MQGAEIFLKEVDRVEIVESKGPVLLGNDTVLVTGEVERSSEAFPSASILNNVGSRFALG